MRPPRLPHHTDISLKLQIFKSAVRYIFELNQEHSHFVNFFLLLAIVVIIKYYAIAVLILNYDTFITDGTLIKITVTITQHNHTRTKNFKWKAISPHDFL